jgi:methylglutaconyl-CoA hydratase
MIDNVFETIRFEAAQEGLDVIMLNRPDVHNACNATVIEELTDAFDTIADHCEA